jgi:predicted metal-dependent hydrolase
MQLFVHQETTEPNRTKVLREWYRSYLKQRIPELLAQWQPVLGVEIRDFGVKNMKTRWGSCNINRKRIWLGLQLAQRPAECLEYVVVHELLHLIEKHHNARFYSLMDRFLPRWQHSRSLLTTL